MKTIFALFLAGGLTFLAVAPAVAEECTLSDISIAVNPTYCLENPDGTGECLKEENGCNRSIFYHEKTVMEKGEPKTTREEIIYNRYKEIYSEWVKNYPPEREGYPKFKKI